MSKGKRGVGKEYDYSFCSCDSFLCVIVFNNCEEKAIIPDTKFTFKNNLSSVFIGLVLSYLKENSRRFF